MRLVHSMSWAEPNCVQCCAPVGQHAPKRLPCSYEPHRPPAEPKGLPAWPLLLLLLLLLLQGLGAKPRAKQLRRCMEFIDLRKRSGLAAEHFVADSFYGGAYRHYEALLRRAGAIDFNDMLLLLQRLVLTQPLVLQRLQDRCPTLPHCQARPGWTAADCTTHGHTDVCMRRGQLDGCSR